MRNVWEMLFLKKFLRSISMRLMDGRDAIGCRTVRTKKWGCCIKRRTKTQKTIKGVLVVLEPSKRLLCKNKVEILANFNFLFVFFSYVLALCRTPVRLREPNHDFCILLQQPRKYYSKISFARALISAWLLSDRAERRVTVVSVKVSSRLPSNMARSFLAAMGAQVPFSTIPILLF